MNFCGKCNSVQPFYTRRTTGGGRVATVCVICKRVENKERYLIKKLYGNSINKSYRINFYNASITVDTLLDESDDDRADLQTYYGL